MDDIVKQVFQGIVDGDQSVGEAVTEDFARQIGADAVTKSLISPAN